MKIRNLKKEDIPKLSEIVSSNYSKKYGKTSKIELTASFANKTIPPKYLVTEESGKLLGFAGYMDAWMDYHLAEIFWVNVHPDFQKKGIGTKLVSDIIKKIKKSKKKMILLTTEKPKFYSERFGFEIISKIGESKN